MEMNWGLTGPSLEKALSAGYVRVSQNKSSELQPYVFSYLTAPNIKKVESGKMALGSSLIHLENHLVQLPHGGN